MQTVGQKLTCSVGAFLVEKITPTLPAKRSCPDLPGHHPGPHSTAGPCGVFCSPFASKKHEKTYGKYLTKEKS